MDDESKRFQHEGLERSPEMLPQGLAKKFIDGTLLEGASAVHEGDKSKIYRCFERDEHVPGLNKTELHVDYRKYAVESQERPDQLRFEYVRTDASVVDERPVVAEMHLGIIDQQTFRLEHRYVRPELKRTGLGSRLLMTVEDWLQQVARELKQPISVGLQTGQQSVIDWARKMGYEVQENQRELLDEIKDYPERFIEDEVIISEESRTGGIVKDLYTFRKGTEGRYMEDAIRVTLSKKIPGTGA